MTNDAWLKNQFRLFKRHKQRGSRYRDVLVVTSFIESIVRGKASCTACKRRDNFEKSLKCVHKKDCRNEIDVLRIKRNELLHDILKKALPDQHINSTINNHGFDPAV